MSNRTAKRIQPLRIRATLQAARILVFLTLPLSAGFCVSIFAAFWVQSVAGFALGALAGLLLCLSPELWHLLVLRIHENREGPTRIRDLRPGLRTDAEHTPRWHPD